MVRRSEDSWTARPIALDRPGNARVGTYSSVVSNEPMCRKDFPWFFFGCMRWRPWFVCLGKRPLRAIAQRNAKVLEKLGRVHAEMMQEFV